MRNRVPCPSVHGRTESVDSPRSGIYGGPMARMIPTATSSHDPVFASAVSELHSIVPFDAVQLLRHVPRTGEVREVFRAGYPDDAAWALQHLFTAKYRFGFTHELSPDDGLPPAISSVRADFREEFVGSRIYRDYLRANGYRDGMSMELFADREYVGIAHFSAHAAIGFAEDARLAASAVRGLLAALLLGVSSPRMTDSLANRHPHASSPDADARAETIWYTFEPGESADSTSTARPGFLRNSSFPAHLERFRAAGLSTIEHLWEDRGRLVHLELRRLDRTGRVAVGVRRDHSALRFRLSLQEIRVLSLLCAGKDDASIASRLHLSRRTVESHLANARRKLSARNRVEAVVKAITTASFLPDPEYCPLEEILGSAG